MDDAAARPSKSAKRAAPVAMSGAISVAAPLVVDLDGTLLETDTLYESFVAAVFQHPIAAILALPRLLSGRAAFKARLGEIAELDVEGLPLRETLVDRLAAEQAKGREIHLVSAADHAVVTAVADRVGLFTSAQGSEGGVNLKGEAKARYLEERFPEGFTYCGDSRADLAVWRKASSVGIVGASKGVASAAKRLGKPVEVEVDTGSTRLRAWRKALRLQQWSKNVLVFVPLVLAHELTDIWAWAKVLTGFLCMGVMASATYLVNDLGDLSSDRRHRSKRFRPLASGALPIQSALIAIVPMIAVSLGVMAWLSPAAALCLMVYAGFTLSYSLRLKRVVMLDVTILGLLYTIRLIMGQILAGSAESTWLLTFSMFFFCSMALTKRHSEIEVAAASGLTELRGRGYRVKDAPLTLSMGISFSAASILIVVIYLTEEAFPSGLYHHPHRLWVAPVLLHLWLARVWILAHRGEMNDDPVAFALRDRYSLLLGALLGATFLAAVI